MNTPLISRQEFNLATSKIGINSQNFEEFLFEKLQLNEINDLYSDNKYLDGVEFIDKILNDLGITIEIPEADLKKIPSDGGFIAIANHPYGILDGLILMKILLSKRSDAKIMANLFLERILPLEKFLLLVNPFDRTSKLNFSGLREIKNHLSEDKPLAVFPAGEVSSFQKEKWKVVDKKWDKSVIRIIEKADQPVLPIYFQGTNSMNFHLAGIINPYLRTAQIPKEFLKQSNKKITVRIADLISVEELNQYKTTDEKRDFLRTSTYMFDSKGKVKRALQRKAFDFPKKPKKISDKVASKSIRKEIEQLQREKCVLETEQWLVLEAKAYECPATLKEIARLREIEFRKIGEGSNRSLDLDRYDFYYTHLILWNKEDEQIGGSYRIGFGNEILRSYGKKGFYTQSLFRYKKEFLPILNQSIELGRSFITSEYQKKTLPLSLLWKAIYQILLQRNYYRYLIGPVSLSKNYSDLSKHLLMEFMKSNYFDSHLASFVKSRKKFEVKFSHLKEELLVNQADSFLKVNKLIEQIDGASIPVLWKQYIKQNAKFIGFNLDPKFNNCLDGLILLDVYEIPHKTIEYVSKGIEQDKYLNFMRKRNLEWAE